MTCLVSRALTRFTCAALLSSTASLATADSHATGSYAVVDDDGQTLMALDIVENSGRISGSGVVPEGVMAEGPGLIDITFGARLGDDLQMMLQLDPHDPGTAPVGTRITIKDGDTFRMLYNGQFVNGALQSIAPGSITVPDAPPEPAVVATVPTVEPAEDPPEPAVAPTVEPVEETPQVANLPASCVDLARVTDEANALGDTSVVQEIRSIYTLYGLAFDGEQTEAKCRGALQEIVVFMEDMAGGDEAEACYAVEGALEQIEGKLSATGNPPSTEPDTIMANAGMVVQGLNPGGEDNANTCAQALNGLYSFLDGIVPPEPAADEPETYDLPAGYRVEPLVNLNLAGNWALSAGGSQVALWSQGRRSTVAYEKGPDDRRVVWFWEPRPALQNAGVTRGTLFVEGTRNQGRFDGEARHYVAGCGVFVYPVTGRVRERETDIRIRGDRPQVSEDCTITGVAENEFRLRFVADNPPGAPNLNTGSTSPIGNANSRPDFGVWGINYRIRNIDRGGALNVRRNPATTARIVGELPHNADNIIILGEGCTPVVDQVAFDNMNRRERNRVLASRWCRVEWNGITGWVYGRYLRPM